MQITPPRGSALRAHILTLVGGGEGCTNKDLCSTKWHLFLSVRINFYKQAAMDCDCAASEDPGLSGRSVYSPLLNCFKQAGAHHHLRPEAFHALGAVYCVVVCRCVVVSLRCYVVVTPLRCCIIESLRRCVVASLRRFVVSSLRRCVVVASLLHRLSLLRRCVVASLRLCVVASLLHRLSSLPPTQTTNDRPNDNDRKQQNRKTSKNPHL